MKGLPAVAVGLALVCPAREAVPLRLPCRHDHPLTVKPVRKDETASVFVATLRFASAASGANILSTNKHGPCTSFSLGADERSFEGRCMETVGTRIEALAVARTLKIDRATGVFEEINGLKPWLAAFRALRHSKATPENHALTVL